MKTMLTFEVNRPRHKTWCKAASDRHAYKNSILQLVNKAPLRTDASAEFQSTATKGSRTTHRIRPQSPPVSTLTLASLIYSKTSLPEIILAGPSTSRLWTRRQRRRSSVRDVFRYNMIPTNNHAILHVDNIFDLTKEWQPDVVPLQEVGRIVLNQNPYVVHQNDIIAKGTDETCAQDELLPRS